ncbi:MAG: hypothetical protein KME40_29855 [Komarekiella atlantica HA4396-MV6]|nr:hypothetical protein [Komarekiella atlantica HA4396-MV6]
MGTLRSRSVFARRSSDACGNPFGERIAQPKAFSTRGYALSEAMPQALRHVFA